MPATLVQKWRGNAVVGTKFQKMLDKFLEDYAIMEPQQQQQQQQQTTREDESKKRNNGEETGGTPKKIKVSEVDPKLLVEVEKIEAALVSECKVGANSREPMWFQVRGSNQLYLVNKGATDWTGTQVPCWDLAEAPPDGALECAITDSSDLVCSDGKALTSQDHISQAGL